MTPMTKLVFVCWGNICRSPMAERVAIRESEERGLDLDVESYGLSSEEAGNPIDRRAVRTLTANGYDASHHRARKVSAADLVDADLVVAVEPYQVDALKAIAPGARIALLNDFNPVGPKGEGLIDPWYGDQSGFEETLDDIEQAMPGILDAIA